MRGKKEALIKLGDDCIKKYNIPNPFTRYQEDLEKLNKEVESLSNKIVALEAELLDRTKTNTISQSDKIVKRAEIKSYRVLMEAKIIEMTKKSKCWAKYLVKVQKEGPQLKKRGRPQKQTLIMSSRQLKSNTKISKRSLGKKVKIVAKKRVIGQGELKEVDGKTCKVHISENDLIHCDLDSDIFDMTENSDDLIVLTQNVRPWNYVPVPEDIPVLEDTDSSEEPVSEHELDDIETNRGTQSYICYDIDFNCDSNSSPADSQAKALESDENKNCTKTRSNMLNTENIIESRKGSQNDNMHLHPLVNHSDENGSIIQSTEGQQINDETLDTDTERSTNRDLDIINLNQCQFTIEGSIKASNACTGICLKMVEKYLCQSDEELDIVNKTNLGETYLKIIKEVVEYWNKSQLPSLDVIKALQLPIFEKVKELDYKDIFFHSILLDGENSDCKKAFEAAIKDDRKHAVVFTLPPDKSFLVLIEHQELILLDSHVRCGTVPFEEAVVQEDKRAHMVSMEKDFNRMYNYIFSDLCAALGCSKEYGSLVVFSKN